MGHRWGTGGTGVLPCWLAGGRRGGDPDADRSVAGPTPFFGRRPWHEERASPRPGPADGHAGPGERAGAGSLYIRIYRTVIGRLSGPAA